MKKMWDVYSELCDNNSVLFEMLMENPEEKDLKRILKKIKINNFKIRIMEFLFFRSEEDNIL